MCCVGVGGKSECVDNKSRLRGCVVLMRKGECNQSGLRGCVVLVKG